MAKDTYWNLVSLVLPMDGPAGSTAIVDAKGHSLSIAGNTSLSNAQSKFGGVSAHFDGTGDYIATVSSVDFVVGTRDFTLEGWFFFDGFATNHAFGSCIFDTRPVGNYGAGMALFVNNSGVLTAWDVNSAARQSASGKVSTGTWYHIAINRKEKALDVFVNGVSTISYTSTYDYSPTGTSVVIGTAADYQGTTDAFKHVGYVDDVRFTNGFARYSGTFTPSTEPNPIAGPVVSGTVLDSNGNPAVRSLRAYRRDTGALVGSAVSSALNGNYSMDILGYSGEVQVVMLDDVAGTFENDQILRTTPV